MLWSVGYDLSTGTVLLAIFPQVLAVFHRVRLQAGHINLNACWGGDWWLLSRTRQNTLPVLVVRDRGRLL